MKHSKPVAADTISAEVETASLVKALRHFSRLVERRTAIPILGGVAIEATSAGVKVTGTDLDIEMALDVPGRGAGGVVVPLRRLLAVVSAIGDAETVNLSRGEKDGWLTIAGAGLAARVATYPIADFPRMSLPEPEAPPAVFPEGEIASLLRFVQPAISTEETRYYLNGAHLSGPKSVYHPAEEMSLAAAATDGHMLMLRSVNMVAPPPADLNVIVPRKTVGLVLGVIGNHECETNFWPLRARFRAEGVVISAKLIEGTFPDFRRVIPAWNDEEGVEFPGPAVRRIARAAAGTYMNGCAIRIEPSETGVRLSSGRIDCHEVEASVEAKGVWRHASPNPVGFNSKFLLQVLAAFPGSDSVEMSGNDARGAWRFRPASDAETRDIVVVMSMRV